MGCYCHQLCGGAFAYDGAPDHATLLQAGPSAAVSAASGFGYSITPPPGSGGPPVPGGAATPAGLGALMGPMQAGMNPAQPYSRGYHSSTAAGLGVAGRGRLVGTAWETGPCCDVLRWWCCGASPALLCSGSGGAVAASGGGGAHAVLMHICLGPRVLPRASCLHVFTH